MVNFKQATDAAIILNYNQADHAVVKGLGKLSLPGFNRQVITVDEFRNEFAREFAGAGKYSQLTFGGNYVVGDTEGQDLMKQHCFNKTKLVGREIMCFLDYSDFFTTDLANDPDSGIQVGSAESGEADKNGIFPFNGVLLPNGRLAVYTAHMAEGATPTISFDTTGSDTVLDSGNGFVTAGFKVGMTLLIIDSTSNDGVAALITGVAAGQLDLDVKIGTLTAESGIEGMEIHGGGL